MHAHYLISKWHCFNCTMMNGHPCLLSKKKLIAQWDIEDVMCVVIREWNSITERAFVAICAIFKCNWRCKYRWSARYDNKKLFYFYFPTKLCETTGEGRRYVNFYYDGLFATITKNLEHFLETFWRRWNGDKNQFSDT